MTKQNYQWQISKIRQQFSTNGQKTTRLCAIAIEANNSIFAMLKHAKIVNRNFSAQIVLWKTKSTITRELQSSKSSKQECNNGKHLPKMLSNSNKLLIPTILTKNLSSSTLITRAFCKNLDKMSNFQPTI